MWTAVKRVVDNLPRGLGVRVVRPAQVARVLSRASRPQGVHGPAGAAAPLIGLCRGFDIAGDLALRRRRLDCASGWITFLTRSFLRSRVKNLNYE